MSQEFIYSEDPDGAAQEFGEASEVPLHDAGESPQHRAEETAQQKAAIKAVTPAK